MDETDVQILQAQVEEYKDAEALSAALGTEVVLPRPWPSGTPIPTRFQLLEWGDRSRGYFVAPEQQAIAQTDRCVVVTGHIAPQPESGSDNSRDPRFITLRVGDLFVTVRCDGFTAAERGLIAKSLGPVNGLGDT